MPPALRKRPFRMACAAVNSAPAPQRPEPDHLILAAATRWSHPLVGSSR